MSQRRANYAIVAGESSDDTLVIRDLGPWDRFWTVTNAAEQVVKELYRGEALRTGVRLFYYDSAGDLDEILHADGRFVGFRPTPRS